MNEQDEIRLRHMLDAAQEALEFVTGRSRADLDTDRMLVHSLVRDLTIIGEAASRVSKGFQISHTQFPWVDIIGMRNWLIHAYFDIDLDQVWKTVTKDLPPLIFELGKLISPEVE